MPQAIVDISIYIAVAINYNALAATSLGWRLCLTARPQDNLNLIKSQDCTTQQQSRGLFLLKSTIIYSSCSALVYLTQRSQFIYTKAALNSR
jgi:hypothetical protein